MIATDLTIKTVFDWLNAGGTIGLLVFIIFAGARKWWIWGWQYDDLEKRFHEVEKSNLMWMQLALRGTQLTESVVKTIITPDDDNSATPS